MPPPDKSASREATVFHGALYSYRLEPARFEVHPNGEMCLCQRYHLRLSLVHSDLVFWNEGLWEAWSRPTPESDNLQICAVHITKGCGRDSECEASGPVGYWSCGNGGSAFRGMDYEGLAIWRDLGGTMKPKRLYSGKPAGEFT
jgi:hypothetical protein